MTFSTQPDESTNETQEAETSLGQLVESREDATIMLDFANETLDQVAFFVKMLIIIVGFFSI